MTGKVDRPGFSHPLFLRRIDELSSGSDLAWLIALSTGLAFTLIAAFFFAGSDSGKFWAYAGLLIRGSIYFRSRETLRGRGGEALSTLFEAGLVAGAFELLIDWALVAWVPHGRLVYTTGNDVVLLASPVWMPLAWACVTVELGYPALRLYRLWRPRGSRVAAVASAIVVGVAAGVTVGFYEFFAYRAGWWRYEPAHVMLGRFCALYIPLGELFMFLAILPIAARCLSFTEARRSAVGGGVLFAAAIAGGYSVAYILLEAGRTVGAAAR